MNKKLYFTSMLLSCGLMLVAQTVNNANVYPSNLEENMYFEKYNAGTQTIEGLYFMILCDGDNSTHVTPPFEVSLYLMPQGSSSREDLVVVKTYQLDGLYHMGSREFKNEKVSLAGLGLSAGTYRLGIWVNSNDAFPEDKNDNATLFKNSINLSESLETKPTITSPAEPKKKKDDDWDDSWDEEDDNEDENDDGDWW